MCNNCIHKAVCSIYMATGGEIIRCRYHREDRKGRWYDRTNPQWPAYDIRHCSMCGWNIPKTKLRNKDTNWNYCPCCGADMRGAEDV